MKIIIEFENRFDNSQNKENFLKYMFATSKTQLQEHSKDDFQIYVNGKTFDTQGEKGLSDRQKALQILTTKEIDIENGLQKAFMINLQAQEASDDYSEAFTMLTEILDAIPETNSNISYVCAVSHFNQKGLPPHIHVFYESKKNIDEELPNTITDIIENNS